MDKSSSTASGGQEVSSTPEFSLFPDSLLIYAIRNSSQDTIYFKDRQSRYIWNSLAHARQFGLEDPSEMVGKSDVDFFPPEFSDRTRREELNIMKTGEPLIASIESWDTGTGKVYWFSAYKYPLYDQDGKVIGTWGTSRDISDLKNAEAELERKNSMLKKLSRIDELSGLFNRRYFYDVIEKHSSLYFRSGKQEYVFSLISLDVDNFKTINDTFGHPGGDKVIQHLAQIMSQNSRSSDIVFRIGGDEYVILLPDTNERDALTQAERIRTEIENSPTELNGTLVYPTVSLGISCICNHRDVEELIHAADERMYMSKNLGRNRVS